MTIWYDVDAALAEVPVNTVPLTDDTDFKTIETGVAYNAGGMALTWHFVTPAGAHTSTAVTPTSGGAYDWAHQAQGMYTIEIPASGGASINNDTEGFGWFTGFATGVLPWRGPTCGFRAAGANDALVEAWSATRGASGTALPAAAADAAGGLPISDAGGLDLDAKLAATNEVTAARMGALTDWINGGRLDLLLDAIKAVTDALPEGGALTTLLANIAAALADTNELQTDWANGGRLDLILDARASQVSVDDVPTNTELATALGTADDAVLTQVALVKAKTDNLPASPAATGDIPSAASIASAVWGTTLEGALTAIQWARVLLSAMAGKSSQHAAGTPKYRDQADSKDRISATTDVDGNRTAVIIDGT